jgi:hypothetical protein
MNPDLIRECAERLVESGYDELAEALLCSVKPPPDSREVRIAVAVSEHGAIGVYPIKETDNPRSIVADAARAVTHPFRDIEVVATAIIVAHVPPCSVPEIAGRVEVVP